VTKAFRWILPLALLLSLTLACGLGGGGEEAAPAAEAPAGGEDAPSPTEPPSGEEAEEEEEIDLSSFTSGLQSLESYRSHLKMTFEGTTEGEAEQWVYEMDIEHVRDPLAQRLVIRGSDMGDMGVGEGFESVQIGDQQYLVLEEGQCISTSAGEEDAFDAEIFEPEDVIGGLNNARRVRPDERINGILCRHYTFDEKSLAVGEFSQAQGEIWIAVEGDYVVKYTLQAEGKNPATGDEGRLEWEYEVRDVNVPITIEAPPGCATAESEFPIMPDATDMTTMNGMVTYTSATAFEDVLAFYQEQMPANGWSETGDSFTSPDNAMLSYTRDGRTVTVALTSDDGAVSVLIMSE
jgi:hypothetical protein